MANNERDIEYVATRRISYRYKCEFCGYTTNWQSSSISNNDDSEEAAEYGLQYIITSIQDFLSRVIYADTLLCEPDIARQYNKAFEAGYACPQCGTRQTWYPVSYKHISPVKRSLTIGLIFLAIGIVISAAFKMPAPDIYIIPAILTVYGVAAGFLSVFIQSWMAKSYIRNSYRRRRPEVNWSEEEAELPVKPEDKTSGSIIMQEPHNLTYKKDINAWKMKGLRHNKLLCILDVIIENPNEIKIIKESFDGTPLSDFKYSEIPEHIFHDYMLQLCDALKFLHSNIVPVTHNAVAAENVLIAPDNTLKLANFDYVSFNDTPENDIALLGELIRKVQGKHSKKYKSIINNCSGVYKSIDDIRTDLLNI
jgi:serine/threonine protein kinase/predicted RNA-binding Zn-ribbon protein involved in translation (DUF1610 family)